MRKCSPPRRPSPWPLSLPTSWVKTCVNPKGILQQSPGLRGTSYPGSIASGRANPNGLESVRGKRGRNPVGVETRFARFPRVARGLATLGWRAQSLRDWARWQSGLVGHGNPWPTQRRKAQEIENPRFSIFNFQFTSVLAALLLGFAGCASTPQHQVVLTGDIMVDGPNAIANGPPRDKVLWQYRTAAAAMRQGKFDMAKRLLDDALLTIQGIYGPDPEARKARGYFHAEARKTFIGEPYERAMAYFYRGVLYWMDGQLDNARACFRSAQFEDSDTQNH